MRLVAGGALANIDIYRPLQDAAQQPITFRDSLGGLIEIARSRAGSCLITRRTGIYGA